MVVDGVAGGGERGGLVKNGVSGRRIRSDLHRKEATNIIVPSWNRLSPCQLSSVEVVMKEKDTLDYINPVGFIPDPPLQPYGNTRLLAKCRSGYQSYLYMATS